MNSAQGVLKYSRLFFPTLFSVLCLIFLLKEVDFEQIRNIEIRYWPILISSLCTITGYLSRAYFYRNTLEKKQPALLDLFNITAVYNFITAIIPMNIGNFSYPYLLSKYSGIGLIRSFSSLFIYNIYKFIALLILTLLSAYLIRVDSFVIDKTLVMLFAGILSIVTLCLVLCYRYVTRYEEGRIVIRKLQKFTDKIVDELKFYSDLKLIERLLFFIGINTIIGAIYVYYSYLSLGTSLSLVSAGFIFGARTLSSLLPIHTIGKFGTFELINAGLLVYIGLEKSEAIKLSFGIHFLMLIQQALLAIIGYCLLRMKSSGEV